MGSGAAILYTLLCLVLVGSALLARRPSFGDTWRMALAWVAIFALLAGAYVIAQKLGWVAA